MSASRAPPDGSHNLHDRRLTLPWLEGLAERGRRRRMAPMTRTELRTLDIPVLGMTCASCVGRVERALARVSGVVRAAANLAMERAHVELEADAAPGALAEAIRSTGYQPLEIQLDLKITGMTCASCVVRVA